MTRDGFNPSRGIAIIQTRRRIVRARQSLRFNPSRGIAIIQTRGLGRYAGRIFEFQSLTRDSNHSN